MSHASARQRSHARWYVLELNHLLNSLGFVSSNSALAQAIYFKTNSGKELPWNR
jgi:hypothetical protein